MEEKKFESIRQLEGISEQTMTEHYKLYQGYVKKTNEILEKLKTVDYSTANQVYSDLRSLKTDYSFALGGVKNHELYFSNLGGTGGEPKGELGELINKNFGSFEKWAEDFKATGMAARGWVWLAYDWQTETLFNYLGDAQNTFPMWNNTPLLALDTYEHAYFLDYKTDRKTYIDAFMKNIDWQYSIDLAKSVGMISK